jgi:superfamily II DNA or RNA helicase
MDVNRRVPNRVTLFLTMPIAWKGTLAQYAGRLHRLNDAKREVIIYDYADMRVPVLARMAAKRRVGYQAIGYKVLGTRDLFSDRAVTSIARAFRYCRAVPGTGET